MEMPERDQYVCGMEVDKEDYRRKDLAEQDLYNTQDCANQDRFSTKTWINAVVW
jgi:hypothetical protein